MTKIICTACLFAVALLGQCSSFSSDATQAPDIWVNTHGNDFVQKRGIMYCNRQPFSGYQYELYEHGDTAFVCAYVNGKKNGVHKGWWENGLQQFIYHFKNGVFDGAVQEWFQNGKRFRSMHYADGYEKGLQQIWQPDGALFANYEARNGRNYGLTGTMHCKNYWKNTAYLH